MRSEKFHDLYFTLNVFVALTSAYSAVVLGVHGKCCSDPQVVTYTKIDRAKLSVLIYEQQRPIGAFELQVFRQHFFFSQCLQRHLLIKDFVV